MPKFFVPSENIKDDKIIINGSDVAHIKKVLRYREGDNIKLCDSKGFDYNTEISLITSNEIECSIISKIKSETEPDIEVTLFQGIPKASKMEYIIQKNTELGIKRIVPCIMDRCVVKLNDKSARKTARWQKVAEEAAKQSGRGEVPVVCEPVTIDEAIKQMKEMDLAFAPYECETENKLKNILLSVKKPKTVGFIIGPEGGFDLSEIEMIRNENIPGITLGKRILRTETAGEAVLSMIMYEIGDINE